MKIFIYLWPYLTQLFVESEMFVKRIVEKIKTRFFAKQPFFRVSCRLWDNVGKYGIAGQTI